MALSEAYSFCFTHTKLGQQSHHPSRLSTQTFLKAVIASREHQRHPGVWRPLLCFALAVLWIHRRALWVNACQTFTCFSVPDSEKTHSNKTGTIWGVERQRVRGCVWERSCLCEWECRLMWMCAHCMDLCVWQRAGLYVCVFICSVQMGGRVALAAKWFSMLMSCYLWCCRNNILSFSQWESSLLGTDYTAHAAKVVIYIFRIELLKIHKTEFSAYTHTHIYR